MDWSVNKPYPEVKVEKENLAYASILLENYTGIISEETAINQYVYQNFVVFKNNPRMAYILEKIAMVEMHHLALLGKTIKLLGVEPKFKYINYPGHFLENWNSKLLNYTTNIIDFLALNINMEEKTIENYRKNMKLINDKYIKILIKRIIEDEILHVKIFKTLLKEQID